MDNPASDTVKKTTIENAKPAKKPRVKITGDSQLNWINEKGVSKDNSAKIKYFPGGTTESILKEAVELVKNKPDTIPLLWILGRMI